jgi:hypothetical protein
MENQIGVTVKRREAVSKKTPGTPAKQHFNDARNTFRESKSHVVRLNGRQMAIQIHDRSAFSERISLYGAGWHWRRSVLEGFRTVAKRFGFYRAKAQRRNTSREAGSSPSAKAISLGSRQRALDPVWADPGAASHSADAAESGAGIETGPLHSHSPSTAWRSDFGINRSEVESNAPLAPVVYESLARTKADWQSVPGGRMSDLKKDRALYLVCAVCHQIVKSINDDCKCTIAEMVPA